MASKIETELLEATGLRAKKSEDREDFLKRMTKAVASKTFPEEKWDDLSEEAQNWANDAAEALQAKKEIPDFPDAEPEDEAEGDEPEEDEAAEEEAPKRRGRKPKAKAKKETKAKQTKKSGGERKGRALSTGPVSGVKVDIKKMLIKDPRLAIEDIEDKLSKIGSKATRATIAMVRSEFRHTIKVLNQEGVMDFEL